MVFIFFVVVIGYYLFNQTTAPTSTSIITDYGNRPFGLNQQKPQPKVTFPDDQKEQLQTIYKAPDDAQGRTVIYQKLPSGKLYGGSGIVYTNDGEKIRYIVGLFNGWQIIDGTKDRYLKLFDPVNNKNLPLIRVAFEPSALFNGQVDMTALAVEDLSAAKELPRDASITTKKQVADLGSDLDKILQQNDAVVVNFVTDEANRPTKDVNDNLLALWLVLRRNNGLADYLAEIK